jgi:hypothetical protein
MIPWIDSDLFACVQRCSIHQWMIAVNVSIESLLRWILSLIECWKYRLLNSSIDDLSHTCVIFDKFKHRFDMDHHRMNTAHDENRSNLVHNTNHIIVIQSNHQCLAFNTLPQVTVDFVSALLNSLFVVSILLKSLYSMIVNMDVWTPTHTRNINSKPFDSVISFCSSISCRWCWAPFFLFLFSDSRTYFYCHSTLSHQLTMLLS